MSKKNKPVYREAAEIVLAFAVAWLFYQGLAFALGTPLPVVSVVSESMFHNGVQFDEWWDSKSAYYIAKGISREEFLSFPFRSGLAQGDLLVITRPDSINAGDVIIYQRPNSKFTIIHRIVAVADDGYVLKGDNNAREDPGIVKKNEIMGKAILVAPLLGYPRIVLYSLGI